MNCLSLRRADSSRQLDHFSFIPPVLPRRQPAPDQIPVVLPFPIRSDPPDPKPPERTAGSSAFAAFAASCMRLTGDRGGRTAPGGTMPGPGPSSTTAGSTGPTGTYAGRPRTGGDAPPPDAGSPSGHKRHGFMVHSAMRPSGRHGGRGSLFAAASQLAQSLPRNKFLIHPYSCSTGGGMSLVVSSVIVTLLPSVRVSVLVLVVFSWGGMASQANPKHVAARMA